MPKYRDVFRQMLKDHETEFEAFAKLHEKYQKDSQAHQASFNQKGEDIKKIIHHYERILCGKTERGKHAKYSSNLSEKFWGEVRDKFPLIDFVGVTITKAK